jgi:hypothetical protein
VGIVGVDNNILHNHAITYVALDKHKDDGFQHKRKSGGSASEMFHVRVPLRISLLYQEVGQHMRTYDAQLSLLYDYLLKVTPLIRGQQQTDRN